MRYNSYPGENMTGQKSKEYGTANPMEPVLGSIIILTGVPVY
jgi:hypothetical protein